MFISVTVIKFVTFVTLQMAFEFNLESKLSFELIHIIFLLMKKTAK